MKKESKKTAAYVLGVVACLCIIALGIRLTMAAFTVNSFLKAVATTNQSNSLFASDVLEGYSNEPDAAELNKARQTKTLNSAAGATTVSFKGSIYNHLKDNNEVVNAKDVYYIFSVEVQGDGLSSMSDYSITIGGESLTSSGSTFTSGERRLQGNVATTDTFVVKMPVSDIGKASFVIKARKTKGSGSSLWGLASKFVTAETAKVESSLVQGKLKLNEGTDATNDAFNYEIRVMGKDANVTLTWDPTKVETEPYFKDKYQPSKYADGEATFHLEPGVATINFYQVDGHSVTDADFTCK